jgi:hypothetical protein
MMTLAYILAGTILAAFISTGLVFTAFLAVSSAKKLRDAKIPMPLALTVVCYFWLIVGLVADYVYNWTVGTARFRKWHGGLYSSRIQDLIDGPRAALPAKALKWAALLNTVDPGHIKRV